MENPLYRSKSYFTIQNFAKFHQEKKEKVEHDHFLIIVVRRMELL
jgi:hypothetical protein